jgi:hypothetical protein
MIPSLSSHDVMYNVIDSVRKLTMQIIVEAYRSYALLAGGGGGGGGGGGFRRGLSRSTTHWMVLRIQFRNRVITKT